MLRKELTGRERVLEIGSGSGQHAVHFADALPDIVWQPSDRSQYLPGIQSWIVNSRNGNISDPVEIDVLKTKAPSAKFNAVFSANTAHIMSEREVEAMFALAAGALLPQGLFLLYGPFRIDGKFTSDSNRNFDRSLKLQKVTMGIRDLEWISELAVRCGLMRERLYAMPANNLLVVLRDNGTGRGR